MYSVNIIAVRKKGIIEVTVTGILPSSCYKAEITDHYPGGNIMYVRDPGEGQIFIKETMRPGDGLCPLVLVPWAETVRFPDNQHNRVAVYSADGKKLAEASVVELGKTKGKKKAKPRSKFIVISLLDHPVVVGLNEPVRYSGCSIIPEDALYPAIYRRVFGPASQRECQGFVSQYCGNPRGGDDGEPRCNLTLRAQSNLKEQPNGLYVFGTVPVFTEETTVVLTRAEPQGKNPAILLLNLTVTEHPGPMKGIDKPVFYVERGKDVSKLRQVQVISNNGDICTIDITLRG
ncbi:MAG: hypothetical protein SD837_12835 [Candidatus Electrothrix scaldis]|nr:MAG: hypothetical protein SD837_12835 [Candidatus Electrothrix sp. GW3-3]